MAVTLWESICLAAETLGWNDWISGQYGLVVYLVHVRETCYKDGNCWLDCTDWDLSCCQILASIDVRMRGWMITETVPVRVCRVT